MCNSLFMVDYRGSFQFALHVTIWKYKTLVLYVAVFTTMCAYKFFSTKRMKITCFLIWRQGINVVKVRGIFVH